MKHYLALSIFVLFIGCQLGPDYKKPCIETPEKWKAQATPVADAVCIGLWWSVFEDTSLNDLEEKAVLNNPNLFAALDRVAQAKAIAGVDRAALYPQVNLNPSYSDNGLLFKIYAPTNLFPSNQADQTINAPYRIHQQQYTMPFNLRYELDLWGKIRGHYNSAVYNAQAQEENFQTALLMLTTDLAIAYFQARSFDTQLASLEENLKFLKANENLVQTRYQKGLINYQDVVSAVQEFSNTQATFYDITRQRRLQENIIATLCGMNASDFILPYNPLIQQPPPIPVGCPSSLLLQRPDISAAERTMAANHALIGVAYASFLPAIELTGTLGFSSPDIKQFLQWKSRLWSLGANAAQSIFDAGRNQSNLNLAFAYFHEASHEYQQVVLTAFKEVEDALGNIEFQSKTYNSYEKAVEASFKRTKLANSRYKKGISTYLEVIDSERTQIQAEINKSTLLGARYISTVHLIKAIGGAW